MVATQMSGIKISSLLHNLHYFSIFELKKKEVHCLSSIVTEKFNPFILLEPVFCFLSFNLHVQPFASEMDVY